MEPTPSPGAPPRRGIRRGVARLALLGAAVAIWLLAPATAGADEVLPDANAADGAAGPVSDTLGTDEGIGITGTDPVGGTVDRATDVGARTVTPDTATRGHPSATDIVGTVASGVDELLNDFPNVVRETTGAVFEVVADPPIGRPREDARAITPSHEGARPAIEAGGPIEAPRRWGAVVGRAGTRLDVGRTAEVPSIDRADPAGGSRPSGRVPMNEAPIAGAERSVLGPKTPVDDLVAFLLILTILLGFGRWSRREVEGRITPVFRSLAEHPG